jgi:glycosyltransferase involved in cell wall biosynthesis
MTSVHSADDPRIFAKECRTLACLGYDVHLIAPGARNELRQGVRVWGVPKATGARRAARMTWTVARVVRLARALDADIYHFHDPELVPSGLLLARSGKTVVYDAHESVPDDILLKSWVRPRIRGPLSRMAATVEREAARRLTAVVAATPPIAERFARDGARAVVINNFPQLDEFPPAPPSAEPRERAVCYVGSISELRGARVMVDAMADVDATLLLAGRYASPVLRAELATYPGWSRVVELGQVGRPELARLLGRSRAGLAVLAPVPTYVAAQPTKVYEYMAAGVPAIASDFAGWRALVEDNRCGLCVDPTEPAAVARAIRWILEHPREADDMGRNGRRAAERAFRWEPEAHKLAALYAELLDGTGNHTRRNRSSETISKT